MTEDDCDVCKNLSSIKRVANANQSEIADTYLFSNTPVIVIDAIEEWDAMKKFDINFLAEVICKSFPSCCLKSCNVIVK